MKIITILIMLICGLFSSQFSYGQQLNKKIHKSQKTAILNSPFKDAKKMYKELAVQKKIRHEYLNFIDSLRLEFPKDTILLIENYGEMCIECSAYYIQIQIGDNLISLKKNFQLKMYEIKTEKLSKLYYGEIQYYRSDIDELRIEISKNDNWNKNPENYGDEFVFGGSHTFYSFIYPDGKIISMYIRNWRDKKERKTNK